VAGESFARKEEKEKENERKRKSEREEKGERRERRERERERERKRERERMKENRTPPLPPPPGVADRFSANERSGAERRPAPDARRSTLTERWRSENFLRFIAAPAAEVDPE